MAVKAESSVCSQAGWYTPEGLCELRPAWSMRPADSGQSGIHSETLSKQQSPQSTSAQLLNDRNNSREAVKGGLKLDPASVRGLRVRLGQPWASQVVSESLTSRFFLLEETMAPPTVFIRP